MGKKLENAFVYRREWDLREYKKEILSGYNLEQAIYVYVGSSNAYNMTARSSKWRNHIKTNNKSVASHIKEFINNLEAFYRVELNLSESDIDDKLYYSNVTLCNECESLEHARQEEEYLTNQYKILDTMKDILKDRIILLSSVASALTTETNNYNIKLKAKSNKSEQYKNKPIIQLKVDFKLENDKYIITPSFVISENDNKKILPADQSKSILNK